MCICVIKHAVAACRDLLTGYLKSRLSQLLMTNYFWEGNTRTQIFCFSIFIHCTWVPCLWLLVCRECFSHVMPAVLSSGKCISDNSDLISLLLKSHQIRKKKCLLVKNVCSSHFQCTPLFQRVKYSALINCTRNKIWLMAFSFNSKVRG